MSLLYRCKCGHESKLKSNMLVHINRKNPCIENISSVDINTLCISRLKENLNHLTFEEKFERQKQQSKLRNIKARTLDKLDKNQFAKSLLTNITYCSKQRNHQLPKWTQDDVLDILEKSVYETDTHLGKIKIPLLLTNGYINSASFDRIDNSKGYSLDNINIIPWFLNVNDTKMSKINKNDWKEIILIRESPRNIDEFVEITKNINQSVSKSFFYKLAKDANNSSKIKNIEFEFDSIPECALFLIRKFIEQGGRCAYLHIPIYPKTNHKYKVSIERKNPLEGYTKQNIVLIVASLNGPPAGQRICIDDIQKQKSIEAGVLGFNLDKLNKWTLLTSEIIKKIEKEKEFEKSNLQLMIDFNKITVRIQQPKKIYLRIYLRI